MRGFAENGEVRGITILYDQAMEGTMDPLVAPMSSAFVPFTMGFAVAGSADAPRRKVEYGTGVFVSATGHVLTDRNLIDSCNVIALPGIGNAERVAIDVSGELVLLRVYGARNLTPVGMIGGAPQGGPGITLIGVPDPQAQSGGAAISTVNAKLGVEASTRPLETAPALGFAGAAALDAQGRFAGMVVMKAPVVAGPGGPPQAAIVPVDRIRNFLEAELRRAGRSVRASPASEETKASVTRVICRRAEKSGASARCGYFDLELRRPLLDERRHAFLLVFGREQRLEHAPLEAHAFGQRRLEGAVDGFLGGIDRRQSHAGDGLGDLHRLLHQARRRHDARDEPARSASAASIIRPVRIRSIALALPTARVSRCVPPKPGMTPSLISGWPNFAVVGGDDDVALHGELAAAAERKARDRRDHRLAAARDPVLARRRSPACWRPGRSCPTISLMSAPAANALSEPVMRRQPMLTSASNASIAAMSSCPPARR